jgi:hypothetical protein
MIRIVATAAFLGALLLMVASCFIGQGFNGASLVLAVVAIVAGVVMFVLGDGAPGVER